MLAPRGALTRFVNFYAVLIAEGAKRAIASNRSDVR